MYKESQLYLSLVRFPTFWGLLYLSIYIYIYIHSTCLYQALQDTRSQDPSPHPPVTQAKIVPRLGNCHSPPALCFAETLRDGQVGKALEQGLHDLATSSGRQGGGSRMLLQHATAPKILPRFRRFFPALRRLSRQRRWEHEDGRSLQFRKRDFTWSQRV